MVVVRGSFAAEYVRLEETFRRLADEDRSVYLPKAIPVLAFSGRTVQLFWGPGRREPEWNPPIRSVPGAH
jgi:hypothetical protein